MLSEFGLYFSLACNKNFNFWNNLGLGYLKIKNFDKAEECLSKANKLNPKFIASNKGVLKKIKERNIINLRNKEKKYFKNGLKDKKKYSQT